MSGAASRIAATRVLDAVLHRGRSLKTELTAALPALADIRDRALVEAICFAALRQRVRYAAALAAWIPKPLPKRDDTLRALLYVGFAQLDALRLPAHAALDATVEAARAIGRAHQAGLVNALLRRAQREGLPAADPICAWPAWLSAHVRHDWPDEVDAIAAASAAPAPLWLRVNRRRIRREDYLERLRGHGIEAIAHDTLADALRIESSLAVASLPGFSEGLVSIQDGAAQSVADALAPAPGAQVLDLCAAPGGKSAHLLEREPTLRLTALDVDARRLRQIQSGFARLGIGDGADAGSNAVPTLRTVDATDLEAWWDGEPYDAALIDAPCSATGIVRRQPDILLHRREDDLAALTALQSRLLDAAWRVLKPGGVLVYATCSILKCENDAQVTAFLARAPDASAETLAARFGRDVGVGRQRLPGDEGMDGFFYARLRKAQSSGPS